VRINKRADKFIAEDDVLEAVLVSPPVVPFPNPGKRLLVVLSIRI
jgi:hypothetical protein